jgi:hypothetical protein
MFHCSFPEGIGVKSRDEEKRASHGCDDVHVEFDGILIGFVGCTALLRDLLFGANGGEFTVDKLCGIIMNDDLRFAICLYIGLQC